MADKIRKALDRRIRLHFLNSTAESLLLNLQKECPEFHLRAAGPKAAWSEPITVDLKDVPLGAGLQLLEDALGYGIAVREYGLLIAPRDRLPPGAVLLNEFWKGRATAEKPAPKTKSEPKR
jgi:hypothetical protein